MAIALLEPADGAHRLLAARRPASPADRRVRRRAPLPARARAPSRSPSTARRSRTSGSPSARSATDIRAGGNGRFGRRDFQWHDGTPLAVRFEKRNVLGFSMDFAEDVTKSNWSLEATWIEGAAVLRQRRVRRPDRRRHLQPRDLGRPADLRELPEREPDDLRQHASGSCSTLDGFRPGFTSNGPWNVLAHARRSARATSRTGCCRRSPWSTTSSRTRARCCPR